MPRYPRTCRTAKNPANPATSARQYGLMQAVASGTARIKGISQKIAEEIIAKTPKRDRSRFARDLASKREVNERNMGRRKNPSNVDTSDVEEVSEGFHGRGVRELIDVKEDETFEDTLAILGELRELQIYTGDGEHTISLKFKNKCPMLCCDAARMNLEIVGGDQELDMSKIEDLVEVMGDKRLYPLGYCKAVAYFTDKHHLEGPEYQKDGTEYQHEFGEDNGEPPFIVYNATDAKLLVVGGSYTIEDEGITN